MNDFLNAIKDRISSNWDEFTIPQRVILIGASAVTLMGFMVTVYLLSRPEMVDLVSTNDTAYIAQVRAVLELQNVAYITPDERTIQVNERDLQKAFAGLTREGLLVPQLGDDSSLFATTRLGMTDRLYDEYEKRSAEVKIAELIRVGLNFDKVQVTLTFPEKSLFKDDEVKPSASAKVESQRIPTEGEVDLILRIFSDMCPQIPKDNVAIFDVNNKKLAGL